MRAENVDVARAADGTYWMVGNDFDQGMNVLVAYESQDGVTWLPWKAGDPVLLRGAASDTLLTPTLTQAGDGRLGLLVSQQLSGCSVEQAVTVSLGDASAAPANFTVAWVRNGIASLDQSAAGETYGGPLDYLRADYIYLGGDNLNLTANVPNAFLRGGDGNDALVAQSGRNVLDGGMGSNFLVAGTGTGTFFSHAGDGADTWSTVARFKAGDDITVWDVPATSDFTWQPGEGADGYKGATLHVGAGHIASLTLMGWDVDHARALTTSFGSVEGRSYLHVAG